MAHYGGFKEILTRPTKSIDIIQVEQRGLHDAPSALRESQVAQKMIGHSSPKVHHNWLNVAPNFGATGFPGRPVPQEAGAEPSASS